ncbi:MAG: hypothetical protein GY796_25745 [Chloroflexi bacterium]|nr:hypothetical protein [Chloroflexota bacterium]
MPSHEAAELIEVHHKSLAEALHMAHMGQITDAPTVQALLLCEPRFKDYVP